jgi:hypothetical protein
MDGWMGGRTTMEDISREHRQCMGLILYKILHGELRPRHFIDVVQYKKEALSDSYWSSASHGAVVSVYQQNIRKQFSITVTFQV